MKRKQIEAMLAEAYKTGGPFGLRNPYSQGFIDALLWVLGRKEVEFK